MEEILEKTHLIDSQTVTSIIQIPRFKNPHYSRFNLALTDRQN
jgi:hypothetical protein